MSDFEHHPSATSTEESRAVGRAVAELMPHIAQALGATACIIAVMTPDGQWAVSRAVMSGYELQAELLRQHLAEQDPVMSPAAPNVH